MSLHRILNASCIFKGNESESLVSSRLSVKHDVRIDNLAELREEVPQARVVDRWCETADKDLLGFGMFCFGDGSFGVDLRGMDSAFRAHCNVFVLTIFPSTV
jgi:hypothetical protein